MPFKRLLFFCLLSRTLPLRHLFSTKSLDVSAIPEFTFPRHILLYGWPFLLRLFPLTQFDPLYPQVPFTQQMAAELMGMPPPTSPPTFFEAVVADQWIRSTVNSNDNTGLAIDTAAAAKTGTKTNNNESGGGGDGEEGYSSNGGSSDLSKGSRSDSSIGSGSSSGMVLVPTVEQAPEPLPPEVESLGHVGAIVAASAAAMLM
jgi:hypothetical protein